MTLQDSSRWSLVILAFIAILVALKLAEAVAAPLFLGLVTAIVLSPLTDWLDRRGLPRAITALLGLLAAVVVLSAVIVLLEPVATRALQAAPRVVREFREVLDGMRGHMIGLSDVTDDVRSAISGEPAAPPGAASHSQDSLPVPTLTDALTIAPAFAVQVLIFAGTVFFFLLSRDEIYSAANVSSHAKLTPELLRWAEVRVARYFLTIAVINFVFGACVAAALTVIGMPQALLWGGFAAGMNFILYLGPAIVALCLLVGGIIVFEGPAIFLPPAVFVGLNVIEGQFVTPALIGRQMSLNPLLVFLSLVFWLWFWGPLGGIVAIPMLLWFFTIGSHMLGDTKAFDHETGLMLPEQGSPR